MTAAEHKIRTKRFARIRLIKKLLRPLPRRTNIHRYPILRRFAQTARTNSYLWSFRSSEVVPALYAGWILALLPVYGLQVLLAFILALGLRANLMILVGLQFVTNPLTIGPLYWMEYHVGHFFLSLFFENKEISLTLFREFLSGQGKLDVKVAFYLFKATSIGAIIIGYFAAFITSFIYQFMAKRASRGYTAIINKSKKFAEEKSRAKEHHHHMSTAPPMH